MKMRCVGVGVYHAGPGGIEKPGDFGWRIDMEGGQGVHQIALYCPRTGVCMQYVRQAPHGDDCGRRWWRWDGNYEAPTIHPSLDCNTKGRCGQHMVITAGDITGVEHCMDCARPQGDA
jgi:hypothetical protein